MRSRIRRSHRPLAFLSVLVPLVLVAPIAGQGTPVGFEEDFALAADRAKAIEKLIPGTEDHFFHQCLLAQHEERFDAVPALLRAWIERFGRTQRVLQIENRQALLTFARDPAATFAFLKQRLDLSFDHQRDVPGAVPDLPTRLDPAQLDPATLTRSALELHPGSLDGFRDSALASLAASDLDDRLLTRLLQRLEHPDVPNLPALVVRQLDLPRSGGFGSLPIHRRLLLAQLEECVRLRPRVLDEPAFVETYLHRLHPSPDVDWRWNETARLAYLNRLQAFASRLSPVHNSLKAHVLHHRLAHDLATGEFDQERFLAYLRLPRPGSYVHPELVRSRRGEELVDASRRFPTDFGPIGDDEPLVRACFERVFVDAGTYEPYADYVRSDWLRRVFAETKILAGVGDMQRWYAMLDDPVYYEKLRDRVEIGLPPTLPHEFAPDQPVVLDVDVKNVDNLLIKVFEIHTFNFHRAEGREVDASIDLDGLVASEERTETFEESPLRRVRRRFEFPSIDHRGVFVIELIGNGMSSRALIRKGHLQFLERPGAAGHVFRVLDEKGRQLSDASIWFAGRDYAADADGEIVLPYSTNPGTKDVILRHGGFSTLARFEHLEESYRLRAGLHVDREALIPGNRAHIAVRSALSLNGSPLRVALLEDVVLTVTATDRDGIVSRQDVEGFELFDDRESVHEIVVPDRLARLEVALRARVKSLTRGERVDLSAPSRTFEVNAIDATDRTACPVLGHTPEGWVLDFLGKDGEPKSDRAVNVWLELRDYTDPLRVVLKTDAEGRIRLGRLDGVLGVLAMDFAGEFGAWPLDFDDRTWPERLQGVAGDTLRLPYLGDEQVIDRSFVSLIELRDGAPMRDAYDRLALERGFLELRGLTPGDYELRLKGRDVRVEVRVTAGEIRNGHAVGADRMLEVEEGALLHVQDVRVNGEQLEVALANVGENTRVHVVATRYVAPFDPFEDLMVDVFPTAQGKALRHAISTYHEGREIGEEYRYILERRFATKFPGNMLPRPSLLLNPWALEETVTTAAPRAGGGGRFGGREGGAAPSTARAIGVGGFAFGTPPGIFPNLAFLPEPSRLLANLRPADDGVVRVPLADLGDGQLVHVIAVDRESTVCRTITRPEKDLVPEPRHLDGGLDPELHFAQKRRIEFLAAGEAATIDDVRTAKLESFSSLTDVHRLFRAVSGDEDLSTFSFVLRWPELTPDEKRTLYSKHACHELHFFLHQKDREFFDAVIRPYLRNKLHKTFLDHWLLEDDLTGYLEPWAFAQLNIAERILLARRIAGENEPVARQVRELVELEPPDPTATARLFDALLGSAALSGGGEVAKALDEFQAGLGLKAEAPGRPARRRDAPAPEPSAEEPEEQAAGEPVADARAPELAESELMDKDEKRRGASRALYRAPDATKRYVEHHYWHRRIEEQDADLIRANEFWRDFAAADPSAPFVSTNVAAAARGSFAGMMLALAVLDLPFEAAEHETVTEDERLTLRAGSPLLLVRQELAEVEPAGADAPPVLVSQNVFRLDEPYVFEGNERRDAYLSEELLVDVAYGCRVVVTNPTSSPRNLELLLQIPVGAIPVRNGFETRGLPVRLDPYATSSIEFAFYFPAAGTAAQYPVHVAEEGRLVAFAEPVTWTVLTEPSRVDTTSWEHVSQNGSSEAVLEFLAQANLHRLDLTKIAWRMRDREFFATVLERLRSRHFYHDVLWSYGIHHAEAQPTREYLRHASGFLADCGRALSSPLVDIDPVERRWYQHVEFAPLFNPRAHRFGAQHRILNDALAQQYLSLLEVLAYRPALDSEDWLGVTYYMLLQDRIEEALDAFARVDVEQLPTRLQYDYASAYLDFFTADHAVARDIAQGYVDHPVERWRSMFREVIAQLDEAAGAAVADIDTEDRVRRQTALAASEPSLELELEGPRVTLRYANLARCQVSYFIMDVEFLFSTHPFVQQGSGAFAWVRPNRSDVLELPEDRSELQFELPEDLANENVLVEVSGDGIARRTPYYANSLAVRWIESYGQLQATRAADGAPLPKIYVKVFARMPGGAVRFHKDGYTDLRGRFDYASLSGPDAATAERYAVLVLSEDYGAVIREVEPPVR